MGENGEHAGQDETVPWEVIARSRREENVKELSFLVLIMSVLHQFFNEVGSVDKLGRIPPCCAA